MKRTTLASLILLLATRLSAQTVLVAPYVQPGNGSTLTGADVKVITWLTDQEPGDYIVEFHTGNGPRNIVKPVATTIDFGLPNAPTTHEAAQREGKASPSAQIPEKEQHFIRYTAELGGLPFDDVVRYRVISGARPLYVGQVKTRASAMKPIRFVAVGDIANGKPEQNAIAWLIAQQKPDFMIALGDIVYSSGRASQYMHHFWPTYNDVPEPGPTTGAPLLASTPFYPVLGNHDITSAVPGDYPDAWAAFHFFNVPRNGPGAGSWTPAPSKDAAAAAAFREVAGDQFPAMLNYSWDYGPVHFVALDSNKDVTAEEPALLAWLEKDLQSTRQPWIVVCFHAPAFHSSREHYTEQKMRLLQPLFERTGVDVVFGGHVHNYQRSKPLRFLQTEPRDKRGRITGKFQFDTTFDGVKDTTPEGVLHIVSGGGGAKLYGVDYEKTLAALKKDQGDNYVPFTAKYYAEKHSFSLVEATPSAFTLHQINIDGAEVDRFTITKPAR